MVLDATNPLVAAGVVLAVLVVGVYVTAVLDDLAAAVVAGRGGGVGGALRAPVAWAALCLRQAPTSTERPDLPLWVVAPALYGALAGIALAVIPFSATFAIADVRTGIVVFGAAEVLLMVAIYLHGWSANSVVSVIGGYRYIAVALSFMLLQMFVLIAVALPAESLAVGEIVAAQQDLWHVVTQPLGLVLWLVVALGAAFWGPLNFSDGVDLSGGTAAEISGPHRLAWQIGRHLVLLTYAVMTAAAFLGGYLGPWLPGPVWLAVKTLAVLAVLVAAGHLIGRQRPERFVLRTWTVLLPLSFLQLLVAGVEALLWTS